MGIGANAGRCPELRRDRLKPSERGLPLVTPRVGRPHSCPSDVSRSESIDSSFYFQVQLPAQRVETLLHRVVVKAQITPGREYAPMDNHMVRSKIGRDEHINIGPMAATPCRRHPPLFPEMAQQSRARIIEVRPNHLLWPSHIEKEGILPPARGFRLGGLRLKPANELIPPIPIGMGNPVWH
jgi:hypothetical protein